MPPKKYNFNQVRQVIEGKNGTLLTVASQYKNTHSVLHIRCNKCSYTWNAPFYRVNTNNSWCLKCSGKLKYTIEDVREIIREKEGTLLSKEYKNSHIKIRVKCNKCNCIWNPKLMHIINSNSWCPKCSGNLKRSLDDINKFIQSKNGKLITDTYQNNKSKLNIECRKCKTTWTSCWDLLKRGRWCPFCSIYKTQKILSCIIQELYSNCIVHLNYRQFGWLKNKKDPRGVLEIDIFVQSLDGSFSLAIEYDGRQHYEPVCFGGMSYDKAKKEFIKQKQRDRRKNYLIKKHKDDVKFFIRFGYKEDINMETVCRKLKRVGAK